MQNLMGSPQSGTLDQDPKDLDQEYAAQALAMRRKKRMLDRNVPMPAESDETQNKMFTQGGLVNGNY